MHMLIVEDNASDVAVLKDCFEEKQRAPTIDWVMDGAEALDYLRYRAYSKPDVILLDLGLPRMNGYELLKELKNDPRLHSIPVIVFSTSRNPDDRHDAEKLGADCYLSKPTNLSHYEAIVERLVEQEFPRLVA